MKIDAPLKSLLAQTRLLAMDVDGVLTDGTIAYSADGAAQKRFHVADGLGLVLMREIGVPVAWISGREDPVTARRAEELHIPFVVQGIRDKGEALMRLAGRLQTAREQIAYIGDDWNDLPAFDVSGVCIAVANAVVEVKAMAHLVTERSGGQGAVREVCEAFLDAREVRRQALATYLTSLRNHSPEPSRQIEQ